MQERIDNQGPVNTNPTVFEDSIALEQFTTVPELQSFPKFATEVWRPFIQALAPVIHHLYANTKGLSGAWQPGDLKLSLRRLHDAMPGFVPGDGRELPKDLFALLYAAIGEGSPSNSGDSVFSVPEATAKLLKVAGGVAAPDEYAIDFPLCDIYSDQEQPTNKVWRGRRVYRRLVDCGALPNNTYKDVAHGIAGIGNLVSVCGYARIPGGDQISLPCPYPDAEVVAYLSGTTMLRVRAKTDWSTYTESWVVIEYTKASDPPLTRGNEALRATAWIKS